MPRSTIIDNPVSIHVQISKMTGPLWKVTPSLTAFPPPLRPQPKNIIFLLDCSGSMEKNTRLTRVQTAVSNLLDKLNSNDTFSIVSFNQEARVWMAKKQASQQEIQAAKRAIRAMEAAGGTNFISAFKALNIHEIIPQNLPCTIIFLTDIEEVRCTAQDVLNALPKQKLLRIVPIGVCINHNDVQVLNKLATLNNESGRPILIGDANPDGYQEAFNVALTRATEHSHTSLQLEMSIRAKDKTSVTQLEIKRELPQLFYNGQPSTNDVYINSEGPPGELEVRFQCDKRLLSAKYTLLPEQYRMLEQGTSLEIKIPKFKWKDNTFYSWIIALSAIAIGALLLTGVTLFALSTPMINPLLWKPLVLSILASLGGCSLLIGGIIAIVRKTVFLPTKLAADAAQPPLRQAPRFFALSRGRIAGCVLAASGASAGYFGGTVAAAANAVVATGISPSLFITGCAVGGALALPLLVYGCMQLCAHRTSVAQSTTISCKA